MIKKHKVLNKKVLIIVIPILCIVLFFLIMQINTNSIMKEIESAFYCKSYYIHESNYPPIENYKDTNIKFIEYSDNDYKTNLYAHFNRTNRLREDMYLDQLKIDLKLKRVYTWHNFKSGYLWIKFSADVKDQNGEIISGSGNTPVKMDIKKVNGKWIVTNIDERDSFVDDNDYIEFWLP